MPIDFMDQIRSTAEGGKLMDVSALIGAFVKSVSPDGLVTFQDSDGNEQTVQLSISGGGGSSISSSTADPSNQSGNDDDLYLKVNRSNKLVSIWLKKSGAWSNLFDATLAEANKARLDAIPVYAARMAVWPPNVRQHSGFQRKFQSTLSALNPALATNAGSTGTRFTNTFRIFTRNADGDVVQLHTQGWSFTADNRQSIAWEVSADEFNLIGTESATTGLEVWGEFRAVYGGGVNELRGTTNSVFIDFGEEDEWPATRGELEAASGGGGGGGDISQATFDAEVAKRVAGDDLQSITVGTLTSLNDALAQQANADTALEIVFDGDVTKDAETYNVGDVVYVMPLSTAIERRFSTTKRSDFSSLYQRSEHGDEIVEYPVSTAAFLGAGIRLHEANNRAAIFKITAAFTTANRSYLIGQRWYLAPHHSQESEMVLVSEAGGEGPSYPARLTVWPPNVAQHSDFQRDFKAVLNELDENVLRLDGGSDGTQFVNRFQIKTRNADRAEVLLHDEAWSYTAEGAQELEWNVSAAEFNQLGTSVSTDYLEVWGEFRFKNNTHDQLRGSTQPFVIGFGEEDDWPATRGDLKTFQQKLTTAQQIASLGIIPSPGSITYVGADDLARKVKTIRIQIPNPELLTGDVWVQGWTQGQPTTGGRTKWASTISSIIITLADGNADAVASALITDSDAEVEVRLRFYDAATAGNEIERIGVNIPVVKILPDAPDHVATVKKYELTVPATSGDPTWQEATGGATGLASVSSDATLTGDGTGSNPLKVATPLPAFPAAGSRDNKVPKFDGNVLGWETDSGGGGGGTDVAEWAERGNTDDIPGSKTFNGLFKSESQEISAANTTINFQVGTGTTDNPVLIDETDAADSSFSIPESDPGGYIRCRYNLVTSRAVGELPRDIEIILRNNVGGAIIAKHNIKEGGTGVAQFATPNAGAVKWANRVVTTGTFNGSLTISKTSYYKSVSLAEPAIEEVVDPIVSQEAEQRQRTDQQLRDEINRLEALSAIVDALPEPDTTRNSAIVWTGNASTTADLYEVPDEGFIQVEIPAIGITPILPVSYLKQIDSQGGTHGSELFRGSQGATTAIVSVSHRVEGVSGFVRRTGFYIGVHREGSAFQQFNDKRFFLIVRHWPEARASDGHTVSDLAALGARVEALEEGEDARGVVALTSGPSITWDVDDGRIGSLEARHNFTLTITGGGNGGFAVLRVLQDSTGGRTMTLSNGIVLDGRTAPVLSTAGGKHDNILFMKRGTTWVYIGTILDGEIIGGSGGGSGLSDVSSDATLTGDGTASDPLKVANPFSATEKTKLAGIEAGATADQTAAQIKTAYESNTNTNAFTDARRDKLTGIETGAQRNVGVTYTQTEKTKLAGVETGATADQTGAEIKGALEGLSGNARLDASAIKDLPSGGGGISQATFDAEKALRVSGDDLQAITVGTLSALNTALTAQATADTPLEILFTADVTRSGTTYDKGDVAYVPPKSSSIESRFNVVSQAEAAQAVANASDIGYQEIGTTSELSSLRNSQVTSVKPILVLFTKSVDQTRQGVRIQVAENQLRYFKPGDPIGRNFFIRSASLTQRQQVGLLNLTPDPAAFAFSTVAELTVAVKTINLGITNPEILTGDVWVEGWAQGQRGLTRTKWTTSTSSLRIQFTDSIAGNIADNIEGDTHLGVDLRFYDAASAGNELERIGVNIPVVKILPDAPDHAATAKRYELSVPATSGDPTWAEATGGGEVTGVADTDIGAALNLNGPNTVWVTYNITEDIEGDKYYYFLNRIGTSTRVMPTSRFKGQDFLDLATTVAGAPFAQGSTANILGITSPRPDADGVRTFFLARTTNPRQILVRTGDAQSHNIIRLTKLGGLPGPKGDKGDKGDNGSGLASVASDATLTGAGTSSSPLRVANPTPTKASNTDVDNENDDTDYMTVLKTFRAIDRRVKDASTTVRGQVLLARNADVDSTETDTSRVPTVASSKRLVERIAVGRSASGTAVEEVRQISQTDYDALTSKDANTLYLITGGESLAFSPKLVHRANYSSFITTFADAGFDWPDSDFLTVIANPGGSVADLGEMNTNMRNPNKRVLSLDPVTVASVGDSSTDANSLTLYFESGANNFTIDFGRTSAGRALIIMQRSGSGVTGPVPLVIARI